MRFKDFLLEAKHRKDISIEKALELIKSECKDMDLKFPLWRGTKKSTEKAYLIQGELGGRSSANTSNHYTVIMDHFLVPKGFPARAKSIILASNDNYSYARGFGRLYAIFPFDGVPIGVCEDEDIWDSKIQIGDSRPQKIDYWNDFFDDAGIPDYSYEDLVQGIKDALADEEDEHHNLIKNRFGNEKRVEKLLEEAYTPPSLNVKVMTSKQVKNLDKKELWISGKCVAIRYDVWDKLMRDLGVSDDED